MWWGVVVKVVVKLGLWGWSKLRSRVAVGVVPRVVVTVGAGGCGQGGDESCGWGLWLRLWSRTAWRVS